MDYNLNYYGLNTLVSKYQSVRVSLKQITKRQEDISIKTYKPLTQALPPPMQAKSSILRQKYRRHRSRQQRPLGLHI